MTAVLFTIGQQLIGLYLGQSSMASSFDAAGSIMILLLWVYYSCQVLLVREDQEALRHDAEEGRHAAEEARQATIAATAATAECAGHKPGADAVPQGRSEDCQTDHNYQPARRSLAGVLSRTQLRTRFRTFSRGATR